jgi:tRNA-Thr(GGU) m(6)t(6)A37 methyltransferase TsaA
MLLTDIQTGGTMTTNTIQMHPVGAVARDANSIHINIDAPYRAALKDLKEFSHVVVFWWAARFDDPQYREVLVAPLPYADNREAGVFACRAPVRPNLIMSTVCKLLDVDEASGVVRLHNLDAFNGTPVVDLKPYYPITDRVKEAHIPNYLVGWPEWMPEEGIGLFGDEE